MKIIQSLTRYSTRAKEYFLVHYKFEFDGEIFRDIGEIGAGMTIKIKGSYIDAGTTPASEVLAIASHAMESNPR